MCQHYISEIQTKKSILGIFVPNKLSGWRTENCSEIPHCPYF